MRTLKYIGRRLLVLVPQLFLISIITFTRAHAAGRSCAPELGPLARRTAELLRHQLRLDQPCRSNTSPTCSVFFMVTSGDPGSIRAGCSGSSVRAPATLELIMAGMLIVLVVMLPIALLSASPSRGWLARATRRVSFGYGLTPELCRISGSA
jgi:peptide/nickel transport system permease protein